MKAFQTPSKEFDSSIVVDSSTIEETTVTVAVKTNRKQEIPILDSFYSCGNMDFKPFYEKASDYDHNEVNEYFSDIIDQIENS